MSLNQIFAGFNMSSMGMAFQRERMNVIAENLANLETTRTGDGTVYKRKIAVPNFSSEEGFLGFLKNSQAKLLTTHENHIPTANEFQNVNGETVSDGLLTKVIEDQSEPLTEYNPSHPDADENGFVKKPNVNLFNEMVDMISASRGFEANVVAMNAAKNMAKDSLDI